MKMTVKELLKLNRKAIGTYLYGFEEGQELEYLVKFEKPNKYQFIPEIMDEVDDKYFNKYFGDNAPFKSYHFTIACDDTLSNVSNTLDDIIDLYFMNDENLPLNGVIYSGDMDFYEDKLIMIRLYDIDVKLIKIYYFNEEYLNKFRHDIVFKMNEWSEDIMAENDNHLSEDGKKALFCLTWNENVEFDMEKLGHPKYIFDANTEISYEMKRKFMGCNKEWFSDGLPKIHENLLFILVGLPVDDRTDDVKPIPLSEMPRISLSMYECFEEDGKEYFNEETSIWSINLDGKPILLYCVQDGYYSANDDFLVLDKAGFDETRELLRNIAIPKLADIPKELILTEDSEITFECMDDIIRYEVIDNTLHCIISTELYNKCHPKK